MTKQDQSILFAIIRAAIWTDVDGQPTAGRLAEAGVLVPEGYDWSPLIQVFQDHAMLGVVAHAILNMPSTKCPSPQQQDNLMSHVAQLVRMRFKLRQTIIEVFRKLEESGCHPILLKGEGLASLYPPTCQRSVGDIDVFVGEEEYATACRLLLSMNAIPSGTDDYSKCTLHFEVDYNGAHIEIHRKLMDTFIQSLSQHLNKWAIDMLNCQGVDYVTLGNVKIPVLPKDLNSVYVFDHMAKHFRNEGACLRQLVDWVFTTRHTTPDNSTITSYTDLEPVKIAWNSLSDIAYFYLGAQSAGIGQINESRREYLISYIIQANTFTSDRGFHFNSGVLHSHKGFWHELRINYRHWQLMSFVFPSEVKSFRKDFFEYQLYSVAGKLKKLFYG